MKHNARRESHARLIQARQVRVEAGDTMGRRRLERFIGYVNLLMKQERKKVEEGDRGKKH